MSFSFYFEDCLGNLIDEHGIDPMEITENEDPFKLEELSSCSTYVALRTKLVDVEVMQECNRISDEIKARAVHLVDVLPRNSARAVALELNLQLRTVQRWYKAWKEDPDSLFKTICRLRIIEPEGKLAEAIKNLAFDFYYKYPTATIDQLMDQMNNSFGDLTISKRTLYRYMDDLWIFTLKKVQLEPAEMMKEIGVDYMNNSVFIDESGFNANLRRTQGWTPKGEADKVKVFTTRANSISILGAISAKGLIKISLRKPMSSSRKRKLAGGRK
ncbi:hypothetical protein INT47_004875 [Mucor saturninus]|uniref:Transposase n=1 Tax=Mucor saturninus TaxID=64648 RepID=A0A8H7QE72_9FUNG|nr:hypothetical protein INT47_004875 [Mucor saturninus]